LEAFSQAKIQQNAIAAGALPCTGPAAELTILSRDASVGCGDPGEQTSYDDLEALLVSTISALAHCHETRLIL